MVARLTPDQKVACSIHVGFNPDPTGSLFFSVGALLLLSDFFFSFATSCHAPSGVVHQELTKTARVHIKLALG
jgi:hypothetical protein